MRSDGSKVRVGVIGAGWWGTTAHIPAIKAHPAAELVAIQHRSPEKAERIARDFAVPQAYADPLAMLDSAALDAVVVSSTPNVHHAHAMASMERGVHVLCEKPFTLTARQAHELVSAAGQRGLQLLISCPWHFTPHGISARKLIIGGELGAVRMISILMTNPVHRLLRGLDTSPTHGTDVYLPPEPGSYSDPRIAGGGQIYCQVSHAAAYLTFLTGAMPSEVCARFEEDGSSTDIYDTLLIRLEGGTLVTLASTGATPRSLRNYEVRVFGTRGVILLDLWEGAMTHVDFKDQRRQFPPLTPEQVYPHFAPASNLVDAVLDPRSNGSPGVLGLASMQVVEAACLSAAQGGRWVSVEELR